MASGLHGWACLDGMTDAWREGGGWRDEMGWAGLRGEGALMEAKRSVP